jgi:hypothetical protein
MRLFIIVGINTRSYEFQQKFHINQVVDDKSATSKMLWNYQGCHDAPLSIRFLEYILTFFRCKGAPFWASYWAKIKFNINRKKVNFDSIAFSKNCQGKSLRSDAHLSHTRRFDIDYTAKDGEAYTRSVLTLNRLCTLNPELYRQLRIFLIKSPPSSPSCFSIFNTETLNSSTNGWRSISGMT